ncbi:DUF2786 domain-containing protein [Globicatella sanguinis]
MIANDKILEKIRNLLELAEDGGNDEESQTALIMAQKLMLKHKISQNELSKSDKQEIVLRSLSVYKRLYWWEKSLAMVIADNFRVMLYVQSNRLPHQASTVRKIVFMGFPEDTDLAYEIFHLAADSMCYHASNHLKAIQKKNKNVALVELRKAYYKGFIDGLEEKFAAQREEMQTENDAYALVIQVPDEVKKAFRNQVGGQKLSYKAPRYTKADAAYSEGYIKGNTVSLNRQYLENHES